MTPIPGSPIKGDNLIFKGLPKLSIAWTTNSIDFSPLGLFGKLSVGIEELFAINLAETNKQVNNDKSSKDAAALKKLNEKKNASLIQKMAVAKYFISQLYLSAEMCMDRNYVAINTLSSMYPYEVLVTILSLNVDENLQAAAARLLLCLHVDRYVHVDNYNNM